MRYFSCPLWLGSVLFFLSHQSLAAAPVSGFYGGGESQRAGRLEKALEADFLQKLNQLQQEVQQLRGQVEEQAHALEQLKRQQTQSYIDLERRLSTLPSLSQPSQKSPLIDPKSEKSKKVSSLQAEAESPPPESEVAQMPPPSYEEVMPVSDHGSEPLATEAISTDEQVAYETAYALVQSGQYGAAIHAFQQFLATYPGSRYAPNAHYWLGDLYLADKRLDEASAAFNLILQQYPTHQKFADASLKLGMVYYERGELPKAEEILAQVVSNYPQTPVARLAEAKLRQIRR